MNDRNGRLIFSLGEIDEKYIKEADSKMRTSLIIKAAVCFAVVIALGLYLFLPFGPVTSDLSAYEGSSYFPLIETIENYRLSFKQPIYKNNFEGIAALFDSLKYFGAVMAPDGNDMADMPESDGAVGDSNAPGSNGSYVESTDNQVEGVVESDLFKMTEKFIFRIGNGVLRVYSIEKENSTLVSEFSIPAFEGERNSSNVEMYLSLDGNTVTLLKEFNDGNGKGKIGVISLDASDVNNIKEKGRVSIDGALNTSRMAEGKLLLVTEYYFNSNNVDYNDPSTFVPTINSGDGPKCIEFEDIIFPETVGNTRYSVVTLLDETSLELLGANALLNFVNDVYVSKDNVYVIREYVKENRNGNNYDRSNTTDIAVLNYSGERLEKKGIITVRGYAEDQYSFDEKDGYLRVVTSTVDTAATTVDGVASFNMKENVSLYIFNLADNCLAYKVEDFAIEGEEATAVRFDGDKCYICTAVVVNFDDPVYFFDLSDYENITYTDTGVIEGYSDHLINLGEGFLLGIGQENWQYSKVEVYEERDGSVVSVAEFKFDGNYSTDYKSYLVNREYDFFGFGVDYYTFINEQTGKTEYGNFYILLQFNGYELIPRVIEVNNMRADTVRAAYVDGYLYITTPTNLKVEKIN